MTEGATMTTDRVLAEKKLDEFIGWRASSCAKGLPEYGRLRNA